MNRPELRPIIAKVLGTICCILSRTSFEKPNPKEKSKDFTKNIICCYECDDSGMPSSSENDGAQAFEAYEPFFDLLDSSCMDNLSQLKKEQYMSTIICNFLEYSFPRLLRHCRLEIQKKTKLIIKTIKKLQKIDQTPEIEESLLKFCSIISHANGTTFLGSETVLSKVIEFLKSQSSTIQNSPHQGSYQFLFLKMLSKIGFVVEGNNLASILTELIDKLDHFDPKIRIQSIIDIGNIAKFRGISTESLLTHPSIANK